MFRASGGRVRGSGTTGFRVWGLGQVGKDENEAQLNVIFSRDLGPERGCRAEGWRLGTL